MTGQEGSEEQDRRAAMDAWVAALGGGQRIGDGPASESRSVDAAWWSERGQDYWRLETGGLMLSPAPFDVAVRLGLCDEEVVITGLHIETDGVPLRDRDLRLVSLRRLLEDSHERHNIARTGRAPVYGRRVEQLRPRRPGRRGYDDEHFRQVAEVYTEIRARHPEAPTARTAEVLHASHATVRRWVARARDLGFIQEDDR